MASAAAAAGARKAASHFHPFRYAPHPSLNVFGYAEALRADVDLRWKAFAAAPLALAAGWWAARRVARAVGATVMHGHWVIPGGAIGATATPRAAARHQPARVGCLRRRASRDRGARRGTRVRARRMGHRLQRRSASRALRLGADEQRSEVVPYGVDADRFRPDPAVRAEVRAALGIDDATPMVFAAGRFVRKKGFEYLIDAIARLAAREAARVGPSLHVITRDARDGRRWRSARRVRRAARVTLESPNASASSGCSRRMPWRGISRPPM